MRAGARFGMALGTLLALAGCEPSQPVETPATVVRPTFAPPPLAPSFVSIVSVARFPAITYRVTAPRTHALFLENCNGARPWGLEHEEAGAWVPAWTAELNGCHSQPLEIAAGTAREFSETVSLRPGETLPPPPYRVAAYGVYFTHDSPDHAANREVPHDFRLSAAFTPAAAQLSSP
jgi:hypothetical protein